MLNASFSSTIICNKIIVQNINNNISQAFSLLQNGNVCDFLLKEWQITYLIRQDYVHLNVIVYVEFYTIRMQIYKVKKEKNCRENR